MSIPPNQFRRDHPWTRFVLLDSLAGPVPLQAKVTHSLTLSLKKSNYAHAKKTHFFSLVSLGHLDVFVIHRHLTSTQRKKYIVKCFYHGHNE